MFLRYGSEVIDGPRESVEGEKRLAAIEVDETTGLEMRGQKVQGPDQGRKIEILLSSRLIAVGTIKITRVGQDDGETGQLQFFERMVGYRRRASNRFPPIKRSKCGASDVNFGSGWFR